MKAFITGISGFAGSYLAEHLLSQKNIEVCGTYLTEQSLQNLSTIKNSLTLFQADLNEREKIFDVISKAKPDMVFHLAAIAATGESYNNAGEVITNNIKAQLNLLDALLENKLFNCKTLIVSSAEVYGDVRKEDLPINEDTPLRPVNPYAVSKIAQDFLGLQYFLSHKLPIIRTRPFNHIGPRQSPSFVVPAFAKKIAEIEKGTNPPVLTAGNLDTRRDFTDVRDMVVAYAQLMDKGVLGEVYNIGSGTSYKISDVLNRLLSFSEKKIKVEVDESQFRKNDTEESRCDNKKIAGLTGWKASTPIEKSLKDTLDYWRNIV